jgi:RNA polymerase sigma factor (sigma-70 family)
MVIVQTGEIALAGTSATAGGDSDVVDLELDALYRTLATQVERIVRFAVQAPDPLIEDACQFAWVRLVHNQTRVRADAALTWLVRTALHEAFKLLRRSRREQSLDAELEDRPELPTPDLRPGPADLCEQRERLRLPAELSPYHQRLLWSYGLGLKYAEIAARDGVPQRVVERQLARARASLRAAEQ